MLFCRSGAGGGAVTEDRSSIAAAAATDTLLFDRCVVVKDPADDSAETTVWTKYSFDRPAFFDNQSLHKKSHSPPDELLILTAETCHWGYLVVPPF
jgi:hypothetical protein